VLSFFVIISPFFIFVENMTHWHVSPAVKAGGGGGELATWVGQPSVTSALDRTYEQDGDSAADLYCIFCINEVNSKWDAPIIEYGTVNIPVWCSAYEPQHAQGYQPVFLHNERFATVYRNS
jgi:hypothetical protein